MNLYKETQRTFTLTKEGIATAGVVSFAERLRSYMDTGPIGAAFLGAGDPEATGKSAYQFPTPSCCPPPHRMVTR